MRDRADQPASPRRSGGAAFYVLTAGAVVLGWQIALQPMIQRAPVEVAIRLAPASPLVLGRAAESELSAGRVDNAAALGREALAKAPFDVRALRVVGLSEARSGQEDVADDLLTLAGNWSLRDDPAHAWLVERRLRQGDYGSAFAHADTLVRRRPNIRAQVFQLFTLAGVEDPQRSLPVLADLLAADPPWRRAYFNSLGGSPEHLLVQMNLAVLLQASRAPLTDAELQQLYYALLRKGLIDAVSTVRAQLNRPAAGVTVTNGGFNEARDPRPFKWLLAQEAGVVAEIVADDLRPANRALRIDYNGYATAHIAEQLTILAPGAYRFSTEVRAEAGDPAARLAWTLTCATGNRRIASIPAGIQASGPDEWRTLSAQFEVPAACPAQWLRLQTRADNRRSPTVVWFDRITITPAS